MGTDMTREEAIKELRGFIGQLTEGCQEAIKVLIPELAESEDEQMRKAIVNLVLKAQQQEETSYNDWAYDAMLAWLEKQKEQKPADLPPGFYFVDQDGNKYYSKEFRYGDMKMKIVENEKSAGCT